LRSSCNFAGEHCSQDFQGFMEGGASEGIGAANGILGDLKKT
jgi:monoamine oxidase